MEPYSILTWIVIGGIAGAIAKLLMPGKDPGGCIITILLGIAGALLAGFLGRAVGWYRDGEGSSHADAEREATSAFRKQPWRRCDRRALTCSGIREVE